MSSTTIVPRLLNSITRLPHRDQDLFLELVSLLSRAAPEVQAQARRMISDVLETRPRSRLECVARVDDVIEYLETSLEEQDPDWVPPLWRESILPMPD